MTTIDEKDMLVYVAYACDYPFNGTHIIREGVSLRWNPMQDTNDAIEVAIFLQFDVELGRAGARVIGLGQDVLELDPVSPVRALRLAICRAAARYGYDRVLKDHEDAKES